MPENSYISRFTGQQIDAAIQKSKDITKTAGEINTSLEFVTNTQTALTTAQTGEIIAKNANGDLEGTGIINGDSNIFFPKDGRFPSGSIDIGPGITLSENGGFVQNTPHTLDKTYLMVDYEVNKSGTTRPVYWERAAEETNVVIQSVDTTQTTLTYFDRTPTVDSQVNALYLNFANPYDEIIVEVLSLNTGKPIKYFPNEAAWKSGKGGISVTAGVHNILEGFTPISFLNTYRVRFNFKTPVTLMGDGSQPYLAVDRQLITQKGMLLVGEGTGSPDTAIQVRDKLSTLTGNDRLDASHIKNIPSGGGSDTADQIRDKLQTLTGTQRLDATAIQNLQIETGTTIKNKLESLTNDDRLDASAIKNLPSGGGDTPIDIKNKLESLTGDDKLSATAVKNIVDVINRIDGGAANAVYSGTLNGGAA